MEFTFRVIIAFFLGFAYASGASGQSGYVTNDEEVQIVFDASGIYSGHSDFNPNDLFRKDTWKGDWIWLNKSFFNEYQKTKTEWIQNADSIKQYRALFRKNFNLPKVPGKAVMCLTADVSYRLYINGKFVNQGPPNIGSDYFDTVPPIHWFYYCLTIKQYLQEGINTIAVEVFNYSREISETTSGEGMLICDLDSCKGENIIRTDTSWKCMIDTSFFNNGGHYTRNANFEHVNWYGNSFDDSDWEQASVKEFAKDGYLTRSEIPVPMSYAVKPTGIWFPGCDTALEKYETRVYDKPYKKAEFTLDYGKNLTGYYGFEVIAQKNDTIKIYPYEKKFASQNRSLTYICKEGRNVFKAPYLSVYRYLKVMAVSENGLVIKDIHTDFSSYPVNYQGSFACSDSFLTSLWYITRWTTQLCMNDMFYDSPKHQEPIACTGDYLIHSLINYYAFGDRWLTRQTLIKTALMLEKNNYDMFHTSYSLLWIQMIHYYYQYTGDIQLVRMLLPHINKLIELFETYLDDDFLVSNAPDYMFMDWIQIDKFNAHHPPAVIGIGYLTAFYYKALSDAAFLNSLFNYSEIKKKDLALAKEVKNSFNKLLWNNEKRIYKDGIPFRSKAPNHPFFPEDDSIVTYSPHVNTLAVLYDIAPEKHQTAIMDYVTSQKSIDLQPYFMFFVLAAVEHTGQFSGIGLKLLEKWENGINKETYTLKENWQDITETGYGGDYSHAWGGSPLYFMSKIILGIKPGTGDDGKIEIRPFLSRHINWAKGCAPHISGNCIEVSWSNVPDSCYIYNLNIPRGITAFFYIPVELSERDFTINNKSYGKTPRKVKLEGGSYEIAFRDICLSSKILKNNQSGFVK
jgi:hypothetical protein